MVQVLPPVPSFGEKLGSVLTQAGNSVVEGIKKRNAFSALMALENPQGTQNGQSPMDKLGQNNAITPFANIARFQAAETAFGKEGAQAYMRSVENAQKLAQKEAIDIRKEDRGYQREKINKFSEQFTKNRENFVKQRQDLDSALQAVQSGEVSGFDKNFVADLLGPVGQPLKNMYGQQLESSMKDLTIESLQRVSGVKNKWLDQMVKSAQAGIGKSRESNENWILMAKARLDVEERLNDVKDDMLAFYEKNGIKPPSNFDKQARDMIKPYAQQVQDKLAFDTRRLYEREKGQLFINNLKAVPPGTPLTPEKRDALMKKYGDDPKKALAKAKDLGYSIPNPQVYNPQSVMENGNF
jgi:hypothetical protein